MTAPTRPPPELPGSGQVAAWIEVDLAALVRNARRMHQRAGKPLVAMVKADAYGHGAAAVAAALVAWSRDASSGTSPGVPHDTSRSEHEPLYALGVATLTEAAELRRSHPDRRILCSTPLLPQELEHAARLAVTPALHRPEEIRRWQALGGGEWHLSIDTGMQRAGVRWDRVGELREIMPSVPPAAAFTHFHSAELRDGSRELQERRFADACAALGLQALGTRVALHLDNSAAIGARQLAAADFGRTGIALYGGGSTDALPLEQVAAVRAHVIDIHDLRDGDTVSYGATWRARGECRVATLAIGYGDGYRQHFGNRARVLLNGVAVPVVGAVTMDMAMIDVSNVPCAIGDVATLLGPAGADRITPEELAGAGGISVYELFVGLRLRLPRFYLTRASDHAGAHA